ncbi:MAG: UDP-2,3-diacylglucosamine diphosphatase [Bacteroidales bacterium]|nr:UDP-2,3-diacylglucosamine diphosphatase [Bacteroidales bacterium]
MLKSYFVSDVHLGLQVGNPAERESRFVAFLRSLPEETESLYLLGDVWDFWYEYRDVVPKGYIRVFSALQDLMDRGVSVYFFQGNHDVWTYSYFEELGMKKLSQPYCVEIAGKTFCLGHGDGLGPVPFGYRFLRGLFHNRLAQFLFSLLHPWIAFRFGNGWSKGNRLSHDKEYVFRGEDEPLYKFAESFSRENKVDYFVFGHYHESVDLELSSGSRLLILEDWITSSPFICFDGETITRF